MGGTDENGMKVNFPQRSQLVNRPAMGAMPKVPVTDAAGVPVNTMGRMIGAVNTMGGPVSGLPAAPTMAPAKPQPIAPPASAMQTGNAGVTFPSAAERAARMNADAAAAVARGKSAVFAKGRQQTIEGKRQDNGIFRQADGTAGAVITGMGTAFPKLSSVYGTGSARPATVEEMAKAKTGVQGTGRIMDETGDRTAEFSQTPKVPKRRIG